MNVFLSEKNSFSIDLAIIRCTVRKHAASFYCARWMKQKKKRTDSMWPSPRWETCQSCFSVDIRNDAARQRHLVDKKVSCSLSRLHEIHSVFRVLLVIRIEQWTTTQWSVKNGNDCQTSFVYFDVSVIVLVESNHMIRLGHRVEISVRGCCFSSQLLTCTIVWRK